MPPAPPRTTTSLLPPPSSSGLPSSVSLMLVDNPMKAIGGCSLASGGESLAVGPRYLGFLELPASAHRTSRVGSTQPVRFVPHRMFAGAPSSPRRAAISPRSHMYRLVVLQPYETTVRANRFRARRRAGRCGAVASVETPQVTNRCPPLTPWHGTR